MKFFASRTARFTPLTFAGLALGAGSLTAQDAAPMTTKEMEKLPDFSQFQEESESGWFVRMGGRALFNVRASVTPSAGLPAQSGYYDNGFVLPDVSGTSSGLTWNWGYDQAGQITGNLVNYERYSNLPATGFFDGATESPSPGGEILTGVRFGEFRVGKKNWQWGFEAGGGYNLFKVSNQAQSSGTAQYTAASYDLGGILPPVAPYSGTFDGPGPLIDLNPTSLSTASSATTSSMTGSLESSLYNFKLGFWVEMPLTEKFTLATSAGFSSLYADTQYKINESFTFANQAIPSLQPLDTTVGGRGWQQGGYIQARLNYRFTEHFSAYLGGDYQYNGVMHFSGAGRDIELDFSALFGASAGISFNW